VHHRDFGILLPHLRAGIERSGTATAIGGGCID
jgi:hypothetical protein